MTKKKFNFKHIILALDPNTGNVLHFCGYYNKPKYIDYVKLHKELKEDPEFDLKETDFCLVPCDKKDIPKFVQFMIENKDEVRFDEGDKKDVG